jgi:5'-3' exonuclease
MDVYLVDGTYELFRHFFAIPSRKNSAGREVAATRGVLGSLLFLLESGASHLGVATDQVIESFRNDLWPGYKTGAGVDPALLQQFPLLEEALQAMGVVVWPMRDLEADDAIAAAALQVAADASVRKVFICTPDKDMAQCVVGERVVMLNRRTNAVMDEGGVNEKFGVPPASIPDYLALVGDSSDGYPGLPGWGARSAAVVLERYRHLESIPLDHREWQVSVRGADRLAETLARQRDLAFLFRDLATLRTHEPVVASAAELKWQGPRSSFAAACEELEAPDLLERAEKLAERRGKVGI